MAWLEGWFFRKSITLSRPSGAVTDYQMRLQLGESSGSPGADVHCDRACRSDFNDIRFTTADGTTLLSYWIEIIIGSTPNQLAVVWIKADSIGTSATTFYMYYGNDSASAASSCTGTMRYADDGVDNNLTRNVSGSASVADSGGQIVVSGCDGVDDGWIFGAAIGTDSFAAECRNLGGGTSGTDPSFHAIVLIDFNGVPNPDVNTVNNPMLRFGVGRYGGQHSTNPDDLYVFYVKTDNSLMYWTGSAWTASATIIASSGLITIKIYDDGTNLKCQIYNSDGSPIFGSIASIAKTSVKAFSSGVALVASEPHTNYYKVNTTFDNWFVRKYMATEPAWGTWGAMEAVVCRGPQVLIPNVSWLAKFNLKKREV